MAAAAGQDVDVPPFEFPFMDSYDEAREAVPDNLGAIDAAIQKHWNLANPISPDTSQPSPDDAVHRRDASLY
eukprot:COSAG02_NODE_9698_length_2136_cov_1.458068_1_plen_71_part_10